MGEDDKIERGEVIHLVLTIVVVIVMALVTWGFFNFMEDRMAEPEYTEYDFALGNTTVKYNGETLKIKIRDEGYYKISKVYEKTNSSEHWSGWDLGEAPLDERINGVNVVEGYQREVNWY